MNKEKIDNDGAEIVESMETFKKRMIALHFNTADDQETIDENIDEEEEFYI